MHLTTALYHCPCYKSPADQSDHIINAETGAEQESNNDDAEDNDTQLSLTDPRIPYSLFPLEELYFCDDCNTHRCPRCVTEEVVSVYCPTCLFEVPGKGSVTGGLYDASCPRNCFRCPACHTSLQTLGDEQEGYHLKCQYCDWSTLDTALNFTKPTGIKQQIASQRINQGKKRFDHIRKSLKSEQEGRVQAEDEGTRLYRQYQRAMGTPTKDDEEETFVAPILPDTIDNDAGVHRLLSLDSLDSLSIDPSYTSYARDKSTLLPLPTPLRSKRTKRCRQCRLLLVKPDPKPTSLHYRSRLYARTVLPSISFYSSINPAAAAAATPTTTTTTGVEDGTGAQDKTLGPDSDSTKYFISLHNALPDQTHLSLGTSTLTHTGHRVVMRTPDLLLGGSTEEWDHERDMVTRGVAGDLAWWSKSQGAVVLEISDPSDGASHGSEGEDRGQGVQIALFVKMSWEADRDHAAAGRKGSELGSVGKVERNLGFWVVLDTARTNPRPKKTLPKRP